MLICVQVTESSMKRYLILLIIVLLLIVLSVSGAIYQNNKSAEPITEYELQQSFEQAIEWISINQDLLKQNHNAFLWWMLKQAALNTGNETLQTIYQNYKRKHLNTKPPNIWTPLFREYFRPELPDIIEMTDLRDYQLFLIYSLSCNKYLEEEPIIQAQMKPGFCSLHYLRPHCVTHQFIGLRMMQRYSCGHEDTVNKTINALKDVLINELTWDFRVGDAYIQRILMLTDSGSYDSVKSVWLRRFIFAQNSDGGWDDLHPLLPLPGGFIFGLTSKLPSIQKPASNFHATAQAVWLLSMLVRDKE